MRLAQNLPMDISSEKVLPGINIISELCVIYGYRWGVTYRYAQRLPRTSHPAAQWSGRPAAPLHPAADAL